MKLKINRSWRKWKDENNDRHAPRVVVGSEEGSGASQTSRPSQNTTLKNFKVKKVSNAKLNSKSNKMYDAGKELYANNNIVSKKGISKTRSKSKTPEYDIGKIERMTENVYEQLKEQGKRGNDAKVQELDERLDNIYDFQNQLEYSIHNNYKKDNKENKVDEKQEFGSNQFCAPSLGINYYKSRNRRYGTEFANLIAKLAEDNTGSDIEGDEFWDEHLLTERVVTKYAINKCKKDRVKERIVLMLDTSPSCKRVANFYGLIAQLAAKYDDIELYDAPNGRIVHKYCRRTKDFIPIWNEQDIQNRAYDWKYLKDRTVLIFTDTDAVRPVRKNIGVNNIVFMHHKSERDSLYRSEFKRLVKRLVKSGNSIYYDIDSPDKLVEVIKKLK